jgi:alpha-glucoside transport system ATP-binding protein
MIYVTHDQVEAMTLASRIVVLANKGIAQVGTPLELYEKPQNEFVAQFIGSPAMNLLPGEIVETGKQTVLRLEAGAGTILSDIPTRPGDKGMKVNVGIRPEDMVATDNEAHAFAGVVEIVEALGEVTQLYFARPAPSEAAVIAKLPGIHTDLRGKKITMSAKPSKVHIFSNGHSLLYRDV